MLLLHYLNVVMGYKLGIIMLGLAMLLGVCATLAALICVYNK